MDGIGLVRLGMTGVLASQLGLLSCGGGESSGSSAAGGSVGSSAGAGGGANTGGSGGAIAGGSGGANTGGTGGAATGGVPGDSGSGTGGAATTASCTDLPEGFTQVDANGLSEEAAWQTNSSSGLNDDPWVRQYTSDDGQYAYFRGAGPSGPDGLDGPEPFAFGVMVAPSTSSLEGHVVCAPSGMAVPNGDDRVEFQSSEASVLGPCDDAPIIGTLRLCQNDPDCAEPISGTAGTTLNGDSLGLSFGGFAFDRVEVDGWNLRGWMVMTGDVGSGDGVVQSAYLVSLTDGAVYCATTGTVKQTIQSTDFVVLDDLRYLGSCLDAGTGTLRACR